MKKSTRVLLLGIFVELVLIIGGFMLIAQLSSGSAEQVANHKEAIARIGEMIGAVTIPLALVFALLYFSLRKKGQ
jgi:hypothetical protein